MHGTITRSHKPSTTNSPKPYLTDLTDAQRQAIEPIVLNFTNRGRPGSKTSVERRMVVRKAVDPDTVYPVTAY